LGEGGRVTLVGFLSDAHGNLEAFELAVALLRREGATRLYFLGDAVGYLPGGAVVEALGKMEIDVILGNHEAMLLRGEVEADRDAVYRLNETRRALPAAARAYLESWPSARQIEAPCGPMTMVHGSPADPTFDYVYPDTDLTVFRVPPGTTVFMANTHRPFIRRCGDATFVNIGSCGLPRDRGDLGSVCLFDDASGDAAILRFDIAAASRRALERCGPVHPSVLAVMQRRTESVFGKVLDG
jgi:predicted phosphodiesterase